MIRRGPPVVDWAVASRAYPDQVESGDRHLVAPFRAGVLLAAVDGLGHGSEAALAACTALEVLEAHRAEPVVELVRRCHKALAATRGAVMSLASVDALARTLREARSIAYSASVSGTYLATELFPRLGLADEIAADAS